MIKNTIKKLLTSYPHTYPHFFSLSDRKITKKEGILLLLFFVTYYSIVIING